MSLILTGIRLLVRNEIPRYIQLDIRGRNFSEQVTYVSDATLCDNITMMCFYVENNVVYLVVPSSASQVYYYNVVQQLVDCLHSQGGSLD